MIRAVLWDFGGVLTESPFEAFNRFEAERGLPRDFIRRINATNPDSNAWARFERSEVDLDAFCALFAVECRAAGHEVPGREVVALLSGALRPRMVEALRRVRERHRTACITNNLRLGTGAGMAADAERARAIEEVMALFDHVIESSKVGLRKPDPRIYEMACAALDVAPSEAVYLDDLGVNLRPARALGMTTIKVVDPDQALRELEQALDMALS